MREQGLKYRNEWKYLLSKQEGELLKRRLMPFLKLDSHAIDGSYMIRSLYFDDWKDSSYNQKIMGVMNRQKWRIRVYNVGREPVKKISLERKRKDGSYIHKDSASITQEEFYSILDGNYDFLLKKENNLCGEFYYECVANLFRPKVIVDYDRVPLILDEGTVRITFDSGVRAGYSSYDILDPNLPTMECMDENVLILEVKYTEFLPQIIHQILPPERENFIAYSKYAEAYEKVYHNTDVMAGIAKSGSFGGKNEH